MYSYDDDPGLWAAGGSGPRDLRFEDTPPPPLPAPIIRKSDTSALPRLSAFDYMAAELGRYVRAEKRWPDAGSHVEAESALATWVLSRIDDRMHGRLPNRCKAKLDEQAPGWLFARSKLGTPNSSIYA